MQQSAEKKDLPRLVRVQPAGSNGKQVQRKKVQNGKLKNRKRGTENGKKFKDKMGNLKIEKWNWKTRDRNMKVLGGWEK